MYKYKTEYFVCVSSVYVCMITIFIIGMVVQVIYYMLILVVHNDTSHAIIIM